jgi:hypothetical protein
VKKFKIGNNSAFNDVVVSLHFPENMITGNAPALVTHPKGMGTVHETLNGGILVQDFGIPSDLAGGTILIEDPRPLLTLAEVVLLQTMYNSVDTSFYFTDGTDTYKVRFKRNPAGFIYWKQYIVEEAIGYTRYSYSLTLLIEQRLS